MTETRAPIQVVVAYDFSPSSEEALRAAILLAAREPQHVLHIAAILDPHDRVTIAGDQEQATYDAADKIQKLIMDHAAAALAGRTTDAEVQFYVHARIGKPAPEILTLATEVGADLIFIGSHGKTGVERLVLGSVSERVVREAKCPVMVARRKTYPNVPMMKVTQYDHARTPHREPHVYSHTGEQAPLPPNAWPLG